MWTTTLSFSTLVNRERWNVEFFCDPITSDAPIGGFQLEAIGDLVKERKGTIEPSEKGDALVNYIGLEHIQSLTGRLVNFEPRPCSSIKSRSKQFYRDDILFGRLRPNLNKVYRAIEPVEEGICSNEFFVFVPNITKVNSTVLRYLLSSDYVQRHAMRFQTGTALPRMSIDDLLSIEVPVPPLDIQAHYADSLEANFKRLIAVTQEAETLPQKIAKSFLVALDSASPQID